MAGYAFMDDDGEVQRFVRAYFSVLYSEKDQFKLQGGKWDKDLKEWYKEVNIKDFYYARVCCCRDRCDGCMKMKLEKIQRPMKYIYTKNTILNEKYIHPFQIYDPNHYLNDSEFCDFTIRR